MIYRLMMKSCNSCGVDLVIGITWTEARKKHHMNTCNSCQNIKTKSWKLANKERYKESQVLSKRKYHYGLCHHDFMLLFNRQGQQCAICKKKLAPDGLDTHVDHDHNTGNVRGILCNNCNTGLGKFYDNQYILQSAIQYLKDTDEN